MTHFLFPLRVYSHELSGPVKRLTGQGNVQGDPPAGGRDVKSAYRANLYNLGVGVSAGC